MTGATAFTARGVFIDDDGFATNLMFTTSDDIEPAYLLLQIANALDEDDDDTRKIYSERDGQGQGGYDLVRSAIREDRLVRITLTAAGVAALRLPEVEVVVAFPADYADLAEFDAMLERIESRGAI